MSPRPLRILQVVQGLDVGGVEQLQVTMARLHDRSRIELHVCSFRPCGTGRIVRDLRAAGIPVSSLDAPRLHNPASILRLVSVVRRKRIDVLHSHLSTPTILAAASSILTSRPAVSTLHNLPRYGEGRSRANRFLEVQALRKVMRVVIAPAPELAHDAQLSLRIDGRKLEVVPNAVDMAAFDSPDPRRVLERREQLLRGRRGPLVVSVGTLAPRKAHHVLVEATARLLPQLPEVQVAIVGRDGPNAALVRQLIESLGMGLHVACVGEQPDVPEILAAADLFALPSELEGLPIALLEAMAAGVPVVAADAGGVRTVVTDGVTGRLVESGDAGAFAQAMLDSLFSPDTSREYARAARARIEAEYSGEAYAERLTELYTGLARDTSA